MIRTLISTVIDIDFISLIDETYVLLYNKTYTYDLLTLYFHSNIYVNTYSLHIILY